MEQQPIIKTVPNQRIICIKNKSPADRQHRYTIISLEALSEASKNLLSVGGFKLYIYFAQNQENYTFALSSKAFMEWASLGRDAYTTAFNELVDKGYLIQDNKQANKYYFYDKAQPTNKQQTIQINELSEACRYSHYDEYIADYYF